MSHRLDRVASDLSYGKPREATDHNDLHHQSTRSAVAGNRSNVSGGGANKAKQRLSLLFTGVISWRRNDDTGSANAKRSEGTGKQRRGGLLDDIGRQVLSKYFSVVEQLFGTSSSATGVRWKRDGSSSSELRRRRPHTFTTSSRGGRNAAPSKQRRHNKGRPPSAPASFRGSPANSGHLSVVRESSSSSELSTMEELHSAVQAAIEHCKSTRAAGNKQQAAAGDADDDRATV